MAALLCPLAMSRDRVILVAEDDAAVRRLIQLSLAPLATVHAVEDGAAALAWLRSHPTPDVLVTDLMMPGLDGLTLARVVKRDPELSRIAVVILTAKGTAPDIISGINAGARHYITKPFDRAELVEKIQTLL